MTHKAAVVEYNPEGKIVWRADADGPGSAERLPTGNTLVAEVNRSRVVELDRRGRVVAEQAVPDMAFPTLRARRR
jgi:hypothetical protein